MGWDACICDSMTKFTTFVTGLKKLPYCVIGGLAFTCQTNIKTKLGKEM